MNRQLDRYLTDHGVDPGDPDVPGAELALEWCTGAKEPGTDAATIEYALAIATVLHNDTAPDSSMLADVTAPQAVGLVAKMMSCGVIPTTRDTGMDVPDAVALLHERVTLINLEDRQAAASAALRQVGGWRGAALPEWVETAFADRDTWTPCQHMFDRVKLAVANARPGLRWRDVPGLGYVTYKMSS